MNDRLRITEHDTFKRMTEALEVAAACAKQMAEFRPDQKQGWEMLSEAFRVNGMAVWKLAEEAASKSLKG